MVTYVNFLESNPEHDLRVGNQMSEHPLEHPEEQPYLSKTSDTVRGVYLGDSTGIRV